MTNEDLTNLNRLISETEDCITRDIEAVEWLLLWDTGEEEGFCGLIDFDISDFLHCGARLEIELPEDFEMNNSKE